MENPTCDYVPMWGNVEHRCGHDALIRVLRTGSITPEFKERCLAHGRLGSREVVVIALRNPGTTAWTAAR